MSFSNKVYDVIKWIAQYLLPALGTLYFALSKVWNLPYGEEIVGTLSAIDIFLGTLLGISNHNYQGDGTIRFTGEDLEGESEIELYDTNNLTERDRVTLNIEK